MASQNNLTKAEQVYLHIIKLLECTPNFGKTLFYKVLYFSDFDNYELCGASITGSNYRRISMGPAPCDFDKTINKLKGKGFVKELRAPVGSVAQIRYSCFGKDETSSLSKEELEVIDRNVERLIGMTASQASAYSHQDMPFKATKEKEIIDYELVHYRNPVFSAKK